MKIYLPSDSTYNKCYVVQNEDVIRGYDRLPSNNVNYNYRDYYINSDYIFKDGSGTWGQYTTLPVCLDNSIITNDFYYRLDLDKIMVVFFVMFFIIVCIPMKLFSRFFGRWLKYD